MRFPSRETVEHVKSAYPKGTRVELESMDDPYADIRPGEKGTVDSVDDTGTIFVNWDKGSTLGVVYGVDSIVRIPDTAFYIIVSDDGFWTNKCGWIENENDADIFTDKEVNRMHLPVGKNARWKKGN